MQKYNSNIRIIVGVDHGYGNMKTAHRVFRTGVECMEEEPIVSKNFVRYKDKFYVIGESHLVYQGNKTDSEDFYILTLAALAEELKFRGLHEANVILAVGLPLAWMKSQGSRYYVLFEILFWTGMRIGELLALFKSDVNFQENKISISKTYYRAEGKDVITTSKTEQSVRTIDIPEFLTQEIKEYCNKLYEFPDSERLFPIVGEAVQHKMVRHIQRAGVKKIRVHDLRHSACAYLAHQGVAPMVIKERMGHKDIKITLNTYGHLYPNEQKKVADMLNRKRNEASSENAPAGNRDISGTD